MEQPVIWELKYCRPYQWTKGVTSRYSHHNIGFPHGSVGKESTYCRRPRFNSWVRKIWWRMDGLPTPVLLGFPCGSAGKESACNAGDLGLIPGLGRSPGEGKGYPLQYSGLENSIGLYSQWGHKELDMTEWLSLHYLTFICPSFLLLWNCYFKQLWWDYRL